MQDETTTAEATVDVATEPLYIVHVKGRRGTCSIAFQSPLRAIASAEDLQYHGFNFVRITNAVNETIPIEDVRLLAGL